MSAPPPPTVFVSYSHADEPWKDRLLRHLRPLDEAQRVSTWDDRRIDPGAEWYEEIRRAMARAAVAICLVSDRFLASDFCQGEEVAYLLERRERGGMLLVPLLVRACDWDRVHWLKPLQMLPRDGRTLEGDHGDDPDSVLAELAGHVGRVLEDPAYRPEAPAPPEWPPPDAVDTSRLPVTGSELFGRRAELARLSQAWRGHDTHVLSLVGWGGVGKSTLINAWLERMAAENHRGARRVYGWSFYSQGTNERVTSADEFVGEALAWFGDPAPHVGSAWGKGERLAGLVRRQRTLLVLDGLEPLQSAVEEERGRIKDPALATLLVELARENPGLCVITTRVPVADLAPFPRTVAEENLERISAEAGRALLRVRGVRGADRDLEQATRELGGHALAIHLLGAFLDDIPGHPVARASDVGDLDLPERDGRHPRRVMAAFARRFGDGPEVRLLRLLGLFDRPAGLAAIAAVMDGPPVAALTLGLPPTTSAGWRELVGSLRRRGLIASESDKQRDALDAHPLVRQHFGDELRTA